MRLSSNRKEDCTRIVTISGSWYGRDITEAEYLMEEQRHSEFPLQGEESRSGDDFVLMQDVGSSLSDYPIAAFRAAVACRVHM